jgi:hypothetical protein
MVACMILAASLVMPVNGETDATIAVAVNGPGVVSLGGVTQYTISVQGGPAAQTNGTYSCKVTMTGFAATNATLINSGASSSTSGVFKFNLSTPQVLGDLTINVFASSTSLDGLTTTYNNDTKSNVRVITPVVFSVTIKNTGNMTVTNIPVYFYVDYSDSNQNPIYVANVTVNALSTKVVTYNWTTTSLSAGSHVLKVEIDPKATFVLFDVGGTVMTTTFYYNQTGYGTTNALLYVALIVLVLVVFLVYRRPMPRKKK